MPTVRVFDRTIHYTRAGQGPPILLLAGLTLDTGIWNRLTGWLEDAFTLFKVDAIGSGQSDAPRGAYRIEEMANEISRLGSTLGLYDALVVGHSMGGFIALELARRNDRLVRGLVLVSTAAVGNLRDLGTSDRAVRAMGLRKGPLEAIVRENLAVGLGADFQARHPDLVEQIVAGRLARPPRGAGFMGQTAATDAFDLRDRLGEIAVPCLVVHGREDAVIPLARALELRDRLADARLCVLDRVGHFPQIEDPAALAGAIGDFFRRSAG